MTERDNESKFDEMERDNLQKTISEVERVLVSSAPGTRFLLLSFLENAKGRVAVLDKKIMEAQVERESRAREQASVASLAQKEAALSVSEKETYGGFLRKEFFTRKDFDTLEKFYAQTWDRLSESGKEQMSNRIWEGIRRDEYTFTELPKSVREREAKQAYKLIRESSIVSENAAQIPEKDRDDFIRAYESGNREEAGRILERESFKEKLFRDTGSKANRHSAVEKGREADRDTIETKVSGGLSARDESQRIPKSGSKADLDLSDVNLDGVKMAEAPAQTSSADIPTAKASMAKIGPSLGSG